MDGSLDVTKQLVGGGGFPMLRDLLKWPMLLQMTIFVGFTYFMASFHFWAVVTIPLMIAAIWLVSQIRGARVLGRTQKV